MRFFFFIIFFVPFSTFGQANSFDNIYDSWGENTFQHEHYGPVHSILTANDKEIYCLGDSLISKERVQPYLLLMNQISGKKEDGINLPLGSNWSRSYQKMAWLNADTLALVGYTQKAIDEEQKASLLLLKKNGQIVLDTIFDYGAKGRLTSIQPSKDSGLWITGTYDNRMLLFQLSATGTILSTQSDYNHSHSAGQAILSFDDATIYILGNRIEHEKETMVLWRTLNDKLEVVYTNEQAIGKDLIADGDKGFLVIGNTLNPNYKTPCLTQLMFDRTGKQVWENEKLNSSTAAANEISCGITTNEGLFLLGGQSTEMYPWQGKPSAWLTLFNRGKKSTALAETINVAKGISGVTSIYQTAHGNLFIGAYEQRKGKKIGRMLFLKAKQSPENYIQAKVLYPLAKKAKTENFLEKIEIQITTNQELTRHSFSIDSIIGAKGSRKSFKKTGQFGKQNIYLLSITNYPLKKGNHEYHYTIKNPDGVDLEDYIQFDYQPPLPKLHLLSIGVFYNDLAYTKSDALNFVHELKKMEGVLYSEVLVQTLTGRKQTTGDSIRATINQFTKNPNIDGRDIVMVYLSGHGEYIKIGQDSSYYMPTLGMDKYNLSTHGVSFENDIYRPLERIKCRKVLFIDACKSGDKYRSKSRAASTIADWPPYRPQDGLIAFFSCQKNELSWEHKTWQNSAFTEAILAILNPETGRKTIPLSMQKKIKDAYDDGQLRVTELEALIIEIVPAIVQKKINRPQHPAVIYGNQKNAADHTERAKLDFPFYYRKD